MQSWPALWRERDTDLQLQKAFPEISLRIFPPESNARTPPSTTSPVGGRGSGAISPADYVHSPNQNKRRRLSIGDEAEERSNQVPRLYNGSRDLHPTGRTLTPPIARPLTESWGGSDRRVSYVQQNEALPPMRSPQTVEVERIESRPPLPTLPFMNVEQRQPAPAPRIGGQSTDEGFPRVMLSRQAPPELESGAPFRQQNSYAYPAHHPSRGQSLSLGSLHAFDQRPPFPGGEYGSQYQDYVRIGELGAMGGGDNKQRKRRGNLPKETTDKLRAWFMAHLQHPYPTEDEKQDLMRQTGLQMSKSWITQPTPFSRPHGLREPARYETDVQRGVRPRRSKPFWRPYESSLRISPESTSLTDPSSP